MRGVGKEAINQLLSGIVVIQGYFKFERAVYVKLLLLLATAF
jgi:hypothetical protein